MVHWNRKYRTFDECLKYEDGLCILAYLFLVMDSNAILIYTGVHLSLNHCQSVNQAENPMYRSEKLSASIASFLFCFFVCEKIMRVLLGSGLNDHMKLFLAQAQ